MDVELIDGVFTNSDKQDIEFADAQWLYLFDNNNNQYANYVQWQTTTLKNQFIDYYNAFLWIPIRIEILNTVATPAGFIPRPPIVAMRESVLSMFASITIATDQGQTIVNDVNTMMINNNRLVIENNFDWVHCEGSELDYGYDQWIMTPSQTITTNVGLVTGAQQSPSFLAPQGIEPGNTNNAPYTNDTNEFGNNLLGSFNMTVAGGIVTSFNGQTLVAGGTGTVGEIAVTFPDGRTGWIPYTNTATVLNSIGGVVLANYTEAPPGATYPYTVITQAIGTAQNPNQPLVSEMISTPVTFVLTASGTPATTFASIGGVPTTVTGTNLPVPVNGQIGGRNPNFNKGFYDRVTVFQNSAYYQYVPAGTAMPSGNANPNGGHVYFYVVKAPLKLLHDFWMQLKFPIVNVGFNMQYYFAQTQGVNPNIQYPPLEIGANNTIYAGGLDTTGSPAIFYGVTPGGGTGCRLYYRACKFQPADTARMAQLLTTGFTKSFKFMSTDWIVPAVNVIGVGNTQVQQMIEQSVVHPLRVWVLTYANNLNLNPTPAAGQGSFIRSNVYSSGVVTGSFTNTNILVNNVPYWRQNFQTPTDMWNQVKEQFPGKGSMLRYIDWLNYRRIQVFDLTRIADRLQSPTEPVSLIWTGVRNDNLPYNLEMFFLVERMNQVTMRFSSSDVAIVVGNLD
jgi:hypothetical protein